MSKIRVSNKAKDMATNGTSTVAHPMYVDVPLVKPDGTVKVVTAMSADTVQLGVVDQEVFDTKTGSTEVRKVVSLALGAGKSGLFMFMAPDELRSMADHLSSLADAIETGNMDEIMSDSYEVEINDGNND